MNKPFIQRSIRATCIALFAVMAGAAGAAGTTADVAVDVLANCLDLESNTIPATVQVPLEAGSYTVSVVSSDALVCRAANCTDSSVALVVYGQADYFPTNFGVRKGKTARFRLPAPGTAVAYFADNGCGDNSGSTMIRFTKTN